MSVHGRFEVGIEDFAAALANEGDEQQARFFNIFFKALRINCETAFGYDTQLCSIDEKLNKRSKDAIKFLTFEEN